MEHEEEKRPDAAAPEASAGDVPEGKVEQTADAGDEGAAAPDGDAGDGGDEADAEAEGDAEEPKAEEEEEEEAPRTLPRRTRRSGGSVPADESAAADSSGTPEIGLDEAEAAVLIEEGEVGSGGDEGVTRCVCGSADENLGLMIQCETCKCWQHCACMGMNTEDDCPDVYYCEQCRPQNHIPLLRALGFLSSPKAPKRGASRASRSAIAKETARELREAKEAVRALSAANARRLRGEPVDPPAPKRRSTMNSREIGENGWESIPPGLLHDENEERKDADAEGEEQEEHDDDTDESSRKRKRAEEAPAEDAGDVSEEHVGGPAELAKRRRMHAESTGQRTEDRRNSPEDRRRGAEAPPARAKHPNQYTYRRSDGGDAPAPRDSRRSGARSAQSGTVSQQGSPPSNDAGLARSAASASAALPEHLAHLRYLLPPFLGESGEETGGNGAAPPAGAHPEPFALVTPIDPATRIRYPPKRMTLGEMRKRVRSIGEYVTRVQIEAVEREKRVHYLRDTAGHTAAHDTHALPTPEPDGGMPLSMQLVDQLSRDLAHFQRRYGAPGTAPTVPRRPAEEAHEAAG